MASTKRKTRGSEAAEAEAEAAEARRDAKRARWVAGIVATALLAVVAIDHASRVPDITIPREHSVRHCDTDEQPGDMLMCKGAAAHNTALLEKALETAEQGLLVNEDKQRWREGGTAGSAMASAIVQYYTSLAMRSKEQLAVRKVVHDFLMHSFKALACTKLVEIPVEELVEGTFHAPPYLCTEAVFADVPARGTKLFDPTELMLTVQRMAALFCLLGSEYHEGTIVYMSVLNYDSNRDKWTTLNRPTFGYDATKTYLSSDPQDSWFELMTTIWKMPKSDQPILKPIVEGIVGNLNMMAATDPNGRNTWNQTFLAHVRNYDRQSYWMATRMWYEQLYDCALDKMRTVNKVPFLASLKFAFYFTAFLILSFYSLSDFLPGFANHWFFSVVIFGVSEFSLWYVIKEFPNCLLLEFFPELRSPRN